MGSSLNSHCCKQDAVNNKKHHHINNDLKPLDLGPSACFHPTQSRENTISCAYVNTVHCTYTLQDKSNSNLSRMTQNRHMIIGCWSKGLWRHSSIFLCYFSEFEYRQQPQLLGRVFCIELLTDKYNKPTLSIKGPLYNTRDYSCSKFYDVHTNMETIIDIAKDTMLAHGKYKYWSNNCNHFTKHCLQNIIKELRPMPIALDSSILKSYINKYVPQKDEDHDGIVIDRRYHYNQGQIESVCASQYDPDDDSNDSHQSNIKLLEFAKPMTFTEVYAKYPIN